MKIQLRWHALSPAVLVAGMAFFAMAYSPFAGATPALPLINTNNIILVTGAPYNAMGDGATDNTTAIQNAINTAAAGGTTNGLIGGTVEIPAGTNAYLCGPITMKSGVNIQIDAGAILRMLPISLYPGGTNNPANFISGNSLHDIELSGSGSIDGQGSPWWAVYKTANRPSMTSFSGCNRLLIQNLTMSNSPMFHISITGGSKAGNTTVQNVTVLAPSSTDPTNPSHNTDACDVQGTNILVQNCNISTGDDDFTCGGPTSNVLITNNTYGNGHGISIGSYTDDGGVSNITVINCTMNGTQNGIRIKSDNDRGGLVQNITYCNISMTNVQFPVQIYAYYNEVGTPDSVSPVTAATEPVAAVTSTTPLYRNITFSNITATSVTGYPIGFLWARTEAPATNIIFNKVKITGDRSFDLYNVNGAQFIDCNFTVTRGTNIFTMFNSQAIVTNSNPSNFLFSLDGLTTNGYANAISLCNAQAGLKNTNVLGIPTVALNGSVLTVSNNLDLSTGALLNFALGTNSAQVAVDGNLNLGGTNNFTAGPGFSAGNYGIMTYSGQLSGSLPQIDTVPAGYQCTYDTNTLGVVKLVAVLTNPPPPVRIGIQLSGNQLRLTWPSAYIGWTLESQTNAPGKGIGTNWFPVPGSSSTNTVLIPVISSNGSVFLRLLNH